MAEDQLISEHFLREFLAKTTQPLPNELDDDLCCRLCKEPFLQGFADKGPEFPVKMPCGHIYGSDCIMKWLSPISRDPHNDCPGCKRLIIDPWEPERVEAASPELIENDLDLQDRPDLAAAPPVETGNSGNLDILPGEVQALNVTADGVFRRMPASEVELQMLTYGLELNPGQLRIFRLSADGHHQYVNSNNDSLEDIIIVARRGTASIIHDLNAMTLEDPGPFGSTASSTMDERVNRFAKEAERVWIEFQDCVVGAIEESEIDSDQWNYLRTLATQVLGLVTVGEFNRSRTFGGRLIEGLRRHMPLAYQRLAQAIDSVPDHEVFSPPDFAMYTRLRDWYRRIDASQARLHDNMTGIS